VQSTSLDDGRHITTSPLGCRRWWICSCGKVDICMNIELGRELFAFGLITPINCTSPCSPPLLPCPNNTDVGSRILARHQLVSLRKGGSGVDFPRVWVTVSLRSPLYVTVGRPIQSVLMYSGPSIRGQRSGRTTTAKLAAPCLSAARHNPFAKCPVKLPAAPRISFQIRMTGKRWWGFASHSAGREHVSL
jgi:hypothetical protein